LLTQLVLIAGRTLAVQAGWQQARGNPAVDIPQAFCCAVCCWLKKKMACRSRPKNPKPFP